MKKNESQIKIGAILSYINMLLSTMIGFITIPFIIKNIGDSQYGVYTLTISVVGYMSILDFGMHNAVIRYITKYRALGQEEEKTNFIAGSLILYIFISIVVIITSIIIYYNLGNIFSNSMNIEEITLLKQIFIILVINLAISLPCAVFASIISAYEKFIFSKGLITVKTLTKICLIFGILGFSKSALTLVLIDTFLNILIIIIQIIYCFFILKIKIKLYSFTIDFIKKIYSYTFYVFLASIVEQINWKLDSILLGIMKGTNLVTTSGLALQLVTYFRSFSSSTISGLFLPRATTMVTKNAKPKELTDLMIKVGRYQLIIMSLILTGFIIIGKDFIALWVGDKYLDIYYIFLILSFALIIPSCQSVGINILEAKNMHKYRAKIYLLIAIINIIITIILIKPFGAIGSAIGTAFSLIIGNCFLMNMYYNNKVKLEIRRFFKEVFFDIWKWVIPTFIILLSTFRVINLYNSWTNLLIQTIIISIIYFIVIVFFVLRNDERQTVFSFFRRGEKNDK